MRETNARTILTLLKSLGPCSRADLVRETGMSVPTVANVLSELSDRGLIEWIGEGASVGGRRLENLRFNAEYGCFAEVEVATAALRILLTDLNGTPLDEQYDTLPKDTCTPKAVIKRLRISLKAMMQKQSLSCKKLFALTVGVAGITNVKDGIVISVSSSSSWRDVPLRAILKLHFPCSIFIGNDTNLAAIGEHYCGVAQSDDSFIFVAVGSAVGAGIFLNGQIIHGANWSAGEIGYLHIPDISSMQPPLY
jgi:glucokinase